MSGDTLAHRLFSSSAAQPTNPGSLSAPCRADARVRVLDVTEFFGETSGGVRTYLTEKAGYVERAPQLAQVLVLPGPRDTVAESDGVRCYRLGGPRVPGQPPYRLMLAATAVRRIVAHERPSVIEVGSPGLAPWLVEPAARALGVPLVHFYHSNYPRILAPGYDHARGVRRAVGQLALRYARLVDQLFAATIVSSDFAAAELRAAGVDRTVRVPLGVDLDRFHPRRREAARRTRLVVGLPAAPLAAFVGRFASDKTLDVLLAAWPAVARRTGAHLVLIGDGPRRRALQAGWPSRFVHWLPFESDRDRLADVLAAVELYIAPGPVETFGLSALEALASGTPVLSADRGAVSELVARSGGGALYAAGCAGALADAVVAILRADLAAAGARGRAYAEREHAWGAVFDRIFAVYTGLDRA